MCNCFSRWFAKSLQIELKPFTLSEEQLKYVHELAEKNMRMMIGTLKSKMWYKKNIFQRLNLVMASSNQSI